MADFARNLLVALCCGALVNLCQATNLTYSNGCPVVSSPTYPDTQFIFYPLYTGLSQTTPQMITLSPDNLQTTAFNPANPTKIIIPGFNSNYTDALAHFLDVSREYFTKGKYNIIFVDWYTLSKGGLTCYPNVYGNYPYVAQNLVLLIQRLVKASSSVKIHVIGQSLGAHIAGLAAKLNKPYMLQRITGLDPAGPNFETVNSTQRLDSTDATFVDILHTNVNSAGLATQIGHVDAYFNGGTSQPGCGVTDQVCSHMRSVVYFAESINSVKGFWGWQCSNFATYYYGFCWSAPRVLLVGENVNQSTRGVVSVPTNSTAPFASGK